MKRPRKLDPHWRASTMLPSSPPVPPFPPRPLLLLDVLPVPIAEHKSLVACRRRRLFCPFSLPSGSGAQRNESHTPPKQEQALSSIASSTTSPRSRPIGRFHSTTFSPLTGRRPRPLTGAIGERNRGHRRQRGWRERRDHKSHTKATGDQHHPQKSRQKGEGTPDWGTG